MLVGLSCYQSSRDRGHDMTSSGPKAKEESGNVGIGSCSFDSLDSKPSFAILATPAQSMPWCNSHDSLTSLDITDDVDATVGIMVIRYT
jgi:hypothetical protein